MSLDKIANALQSESFRITIRIFSSGFSPGFRTKETLPADPQLVKALKHPAMWRSFLKLDQEKRKLALRGEKEGLKAVSEIFINWCVHKIAFRLDGLTSPKKDIKTILQKIALDCEIHGAPPYKGIVFTKCATGTELVNGDQAGKLYQEVVISGLISEDGRSNEGGHSRWYWRHEFVWKYLSDRNEYGEDGHE